MYSKYKINAIVAMNHSGTIGVNGKLPWYVSEDLRRFRLITSNNIVVMGRKTYESLPNGELPNRINVVITAQPNKYVSTETLRFVNFENCFDLLDDLVYYTNRKIFVIGGEYIYHLFMPYIHNLYLTIIYKDNAEIIDNEEDNRPKSVSSFPRSLNELHHDFDISYSTPILISKDHQIPYQFYTMVSIPEDN